MGREMGGSLGSCLTSGLFVRCSMQERVRFVRLEPYAEPDLREKSKNRWM